jgi:hypothetical protein
MAVFAWVKAATAFLEYIAGSIVALGVPRRNISKLAGRPRPCPGWPGRPRGRTREALELLAVGLVDGFGGLGLHLVEGGQGLLPGFPFHLRFALLEELGHGLGRGGHGGEEHGEKENKSLHRGGLHGEFYARN